MCFKELVGQKILKIENNNSYLFIETEEFVYKYQPVGDCCAHAYIASIDNSDWLINEVVISTDSLYLKSEDDDDNYGVTDYHRYEISSKQGTCSIELRVEHNGYYGGSIEFVSKTDKNVS